MSSLDIWLNVSTCVDILLLSHAGWQQFHVIVLASSEQRPCDLCSFFTFWGALMTPMLYPNCRDPRTAVKTERTKVPVNVWRRNTHKHTVMWHQLYITVILMRDSCTVWHHRPLYGWCLLSNFQFPIRQWAPVSPLTDGEPPPPHVFTFKMFNTVAGS